MKSLKRNITYQTIYQIIITLTPLITSPYLSRVLKAEGLGLYSFSQSIVNYFTLFAMLGLSNYGTRTIAMSKNNRELENKFNEIYLIQIISCFIVSLFYLIVILLSGINAKALLIQSFWLIGCFFDITWLFFGMEEFKTTVVRNIIIKILSIVAIFAFVRKASDIYNYVFIMAFSNFVSQIYLWIKIVKKIKFKNIKIEHLKKHIKPILVLFVPVLAMSIFRIMDKTLLGIFSSAEQSGYYYNADKIINIPFGIITGIGTVMLSSISSLRIKKNDDYVYKFINNSIRMLLVVAILLGFGIAAIAKDFIPLFFGNEFMYCISLVQLFGIVIVLKTLSDAIRSQFLIPFNKEKIFIISVFSGCSVNLVMDIILLYIFKMGAIGATIGTLIAELSVCIIQILMTKKYIDLKTSLFKCTGFVMIGIFMFIVIRFFSLIEVKCIIFKIIIEVLLGGLVYLVLGYLYLVKFDIELVKIIKTNFLKKGDNNE